MQDLFRHLRIHTSHRMETILCERCKVALIRMELKDVYQCPICFTVTEHKEEDE